MNLIKPDQDEFTSRFEQVLSLVSKWKKHTPRKQEAHVSLRQLSTKLSEVEQQNQNKQTFHNRANMFDERFNSVSKGKGKGKKGKGKGALFSTLPRFDLRKLYPSKQIASWVSVRSALEAGDPPIGAITICVDQAIGIRIPTPCGAPRNQERHGEQTSKR